MKRLLLLLTCAMALSTSNAQIIHRDIDPDKDVADFWPSPRIGDTVRLAYDATTGKYIVLEAIIDSAGAHITCIGGDCQLLDSPNTGEVAVLDSMEYINASSTAWASPDTMNGELLLDPNGGGHWEQQWEKFMGIRFKLNNQYVYGWVFMDVFYAFGSGLLHINMKDYAYNSDPNGGINTGQTLSVKRINLLQGVDATVYRRTVTVQGINQPYNYMITDMNGRVISKAIDYNSNTIMLKDVANGIYMLHINTKEGHYSTKLPIAD